MTKIAIVGVGGRTGTMFAFELRNSAEILGIGRKNEIEKIHHGKIYLQAKKEKIKFEGKVMEDIEFDSKTDVDYIFLCTKNPVGPAVKYYYQKFKGKKEIPGLILSQNGICAIDEAKEELEKIFGEKFKEIEIIRISLFNPISSQKCDDKIYISYFLPVRLAFVRTGELKKKKEIKEVLKKANIEAEEVSPENVKNMEFSKLFTNLIGMASAARGLTIEEGFKNTEVFKEEILALKEYIRVVKKSGGNFLNFKRYPIKTFTFLINYLPLIFLIIFQKRIEKIITKGRKGKEKGNIDEIDYYNGAIVQLGEKLKIPTPVNEKVFKTIKEKLS